MRFIVPLAFLVFGCNAAQIEEIPAELRELFTPEIKKFIASVTPADLEFLREFEETRHNHATEEEEIRALLAKDRNLGERAEELRREMRRKTGSLKTVEAKEFVEHILRNARKLEAELITQEHVNVPALKQRIKVDIHMYKKLPETAKLELMNVFPTVMSTSYVSCTNHENFVRPFAAYNDYRLKK